MEFVQTALEALLYSLVFGVAVSFVGFGVCSLLLPSEWRRYQLLLTPLLGWCVLVLALFAVNLLVGVQVGVYLVLGLALVVNLIALRARRPQDFDWREAIPPALLGLGLVVLALAPHIAQRSLGFILLNQDEEIYYPVANYLLTFPSTQDTHLMSAPFERWRPWGWGFQYTVAAVSALAGAPTFQTFLPTVYLLLGLSVLAWHLLLREVFGLTRNETTVVLVFYSLLGLPLWFGSYGYGPQIASLVAAPLATALFVASVEKGGRSRIALAGVAVAAGLVSFYRGIGLQYLFLFLPVFAVALAQSRSARPVARALAVAAVALAVGLPAHWDAGQYYFVQGAILSPDRLDMTGGWGLDYFQPPSVMLGLDAFPIAVDEEGTGPLAWLALPLGAVAEPFSWLVLILATLGSVWYSRLRPMALAVVLGSVISLSLNRFVLNFPYGYVKLMPMVAPLVFALFVVSLRTAVVLAKSAPDTRILRSATVVVSTLLLIPGVLLAYTSYQAVWSNAAGWGQSIPGSVPESIRRAKENLPSGARLFVSGRFGYPVPEDRLRTRQHMLGMRTEQEQRTAWGQRVRSIVLTELLASDAYAWLGEGLIFSKYRRLLEDESYDYYLLAPENDPRLEGLDPADKVWSDSALSLYSAREAVRMSPWLIRRERGSLAITRDQPLSLAVSTTDISTVAAALSPSSPGVGRIRIGILSFGPSEVTVSSQTFSRKLALEDGLTWYTTPDTALPSSLNVASQGGVGVVSIRTLSSGKEEQEFVPRGEIGYFLYASSTLLKLEDWLKDPFGGKKPGSS